MRRCNTCSTYLKLPLLNVDEASFLHGLPLGSLLDDEEGAAHLLASLFEELTPLGDGRFLGHAFVVADQMGRTLKALEPAAGLKALVGFGKQGVPVDDAAYQVASVNVFKGPWLESPLGGAVLDLAARGQRQVCLGQTRRGAWDDVQAEVGRDPLGLDGRNIGADDLSGRVLVCEVSGMGG